MDRSVLKKYARLIARAGANVQPGQEVLLRTEPEQTDFVAMLVEECYLAGASRVEIQWTFQAARKLDIQYQSEEVLGCVRSYEEERLKYRMEKLPAYIVLVSEDPDGMKGADLEKLGRARQSIFKVTEPYEDAMDNRYQWCVAAVPGEKWACKVFPGLSPAEAVEKLWEAILSCSRALGEDPEEDWKKHSSGLWERCRRLNELQLRRLYYRSEKSGTRFEVGLMPESRFCGGADILPGTEVAFNANIPTEEVFVTPRKGDAEGIVYSTRPLSYRGTLINNFSIRFEKGRAIEVKAEVGEEALRQMISVDDGASMLGECALVPFHSPIQQSGILFYETLFDENASCHLALGEGYTCCVEGFEHRSVEEMRELGVNHSMNHEDFMIGSEDMSIIGETVNGERVVIFENGTWKDEV